MTEQRRRFLALAGAALTGTLTGTLLPPLAGPAVAHGISRLRIVEPLGQPSVIWTALTTIKPALERALGCDVTIDTLPGDDGFRALDAVLQERSGETCLFGGAIMATQYIGEVTSTAVPLHVLTPVAKLSDGFSVALFSRRGDGPQSWAEAVAAAREQPLTLSCLPRNTAAYIARLMIARWAPLPLREEFRPTIGEVIDDVVQGRSQLGIIPTALVAKQPEELTALMTFGAKRSPLYSETATFAEITANPKLAFTESVGVLGSPGLPRKTAKTLTAAFLAAGQDPETLAKAERADFPLVVHDDEVLRQTIQRNLGVLERLLA